MKAILCRLGWTPHYNGREGPSCSKESNSNEMQSGNGETWNFAPCEDGLVRG